MIAYLYRSLREEQLVRLEKFRTGAWVQAEAPTDEELAHLQDRFGLDPDLLADALDPDEIPRIEVEEDNLYIYMRYSTRAGGQITTHPVLLVIGPKFVATVSRASLSNLSKLTGAADFFTTQRTKLLLQLLRQLVGTYEHDLTFLNRKIRGVRGRLNVATIKNRDFIEFVSIEDALNDFLADLVPVNALLSSLLSGRYQLTFFEEDRDLIEDLIQTTRQLGETSRSALRTIVNIHDAYSNIMTNNLNRQVQLLTSFTVVLTIPTIVFSMYGMNVPLPGQDSSGAFPFIISGTGVVCGLILYALYRRRWL